jgi:hypothetical protein
VVVAAEDGGPSREITVFVPKGSAKLEIVGTQVVPEFGSTFALLSLGIAVVSVIIYTRRKMMVQTRASGDVPR